MERAVSDAIGHDVMRAARRASRRSLRREVASWLLPVVGVLVAQPAFWSGHVETKAPTRFDLEVAAGLPRSLASCRQVCAAPNECVPNWVTGYACFIACGEDTTCCNFDSDCSEGEYCAGSSSVPRPGRNDEPFHECVSDFFGQRRAARDLVLDLARREGTFSHDVESAPAD